MSKRPRTIYSQPRSIRPTTQTNTGHLRLYTRREIWSCYLWKTGAIITNTRTKNGLQNLCHATMGLTWLLKPSLKNPNTHYDYPTTPRLSPVSTPASWSSLCRMTLHSSLTVNSLDQVQLSQRKALKKTWSTKLWMLVIVGTASSIWWGG